MMMRQFQHFPKDLKADIRYILADIDDTFTIKGHLSAAIFVAMEQLKKAVIHFVPVMGRSAGWCDHIARFWPVDDVVSENGSFYFKYDER